ncbi:MAG: OsmC family protein [Candidatus Bathyarchaeota archaeon]|nr:OsmC family protein [Candidatus Bathyarchaeota archaeon]
MKILHARAKTIQDYEIVLDNGRAHSVVVDQSDENYAGLGATPLELCVMSHAGCYTTTALLVAKRMHLPLKGVEVWVDAVKSQETGTIAEETFNITFTVDATEDQIRRLHEHTLRNCHVGLLFEKASVKTAYNLKTVKE